MVEHPMWDDGECFRLLVECVKDYGIFLMDPKGRIVRWNSGAERILGYTEAEIMGQPFARFFPPEAVAKGEPTAELATAAIQGRASDDRWHMRKDGSRFWCSGVTTALRDSAGELRGYAKVMRDLTETKLAADTLRRSEERYRILFEDNPLPAWVYDLDSLAFLAVNQAALEHYGYSQEEFLRMTIKDIRPPEDVPALMERLAAQPADTVEQSGALRHRKKDGRLISVEVTCRLIPFDGIQAKLVLVRDVTRQRATEAALRASEQRFRALIEHSWDSVAIIDAAGIVQFVSPAMTRTLGFAREEVEDHDGFRLIHPDDLALTRSLLADLRRQPGNHVTAQFRVHHKDGSWRWMEVAATNLLEEPSVRGIVVNCHDVTAAKRNEQELRQRTERLQLISELTSALVLHSNPQPLIEQIFQKLSVHLDLEVYFNYVLQPNGRLRLQHHGGVPESFAQQREWLDQDETICECVVQQRQPMTLENVQQSTEPVTQMIRSLGITAYACHPLVAGERLLGTISFGTRKRSSFDQGELALMGTLCDHIAVALERADLLHELQQRADDLAKADRRKDEFLATLAHELRNPLAPVRNAVQVLRLQRNDDPTLQWASGVLDRQVQQLGRLVDDLLDVSRISRGKITLKRERIDLATVVARAVEISRPLIDASRHQLTVTLPEQPLWLNADPTRLAQVVANLLNNAAKYTEPGGRIRVVCRQEGTDAVLQVRDSGIGISREMLPKIFDLFTQVDRSLERSQGGLGIGLTLVRKLVELHGGRVMVQSEGPGKGSEFIIRLPVRTRGSGGTDAPGTDRRRSGPPAAPKRRVLVVDDNLDGATSLALMLRLWGHEVEVAHDGPAALQAARSFHPEVVLLDIGLPGLNGYEVARRLRQTPEGRKALLLALTGYGKDEDRERAREAGFDQHLTKPLDPAVLQQLLAIVSG